MVVTVHLHTILQLQTPEGPVRRLELDLPSGSTLGDILHRLAIQLHPEAMILLVNGRVADLDHQLNDGDQVNLIPAISGGGH